ncbi:MAG: sterol carrier family protein [Propionibacteriaceae bacterium]|nr:sterol carrier family protein [Propionibacteriaceae bacterium]
MFKPVDSVVAALEDLYTCLAALECGRAAALRLELHAELARSRPDLTDVLLSTAQAALQHSLELGRELTAASCRAGCARLGKRHPGASIEVRVPPVSAVQIGFGNGPKHTRGTPPNVVEMPPLVFLNLATGRGDWDAVKHKVRSSGAHAHEAQQAFPLWTP